VTSTSARRARARTAPRASTGVAAYTCDCSTAPGWQGARCDEDFPECGSSPCVNGTCVEGTAGSGEHTCTCDAGYEGATCAIVTALCTANPCRNGGTCAMGDPGEYTCTCPTGYEGDDCETNPDDCATDPCLNGGTCADGLGRFTCSCPAGFGGPTCASVVTGCGDDPCLNATACNDTGPGIYECVCEPGWEGAQCEIDTNECAGAPCLHGGTCIDGTASFTCDCSTAAGWEGTLCDDVTDLCAPNPCLNGGTCSMPTAGAVACACAGGYSGTTCELPPGTTHCVLTYALALGNGNDGPGYAGSNIRIRNTTASLGDGTHAIGPGTLILRVLSDGGTSPAPGPAEVLYYHLEQSFVTATFGITVTTDVDAFSPMLGTTTNTTAQATGVLALGATPTIAWGPCSYPAGYNTSNTSFTPDIVGTGTGCLAPYRSVGNVNCLDESSLASCSSGSLMDGDNPQDETWEQALSTLTFSADLTSFRMPFMLVPNRSPSRISVSWGGTRVSIVCD
jgi:hypothetical protein